MSESDYVDELQLEMAHSEIERLEAEIKVLNEALEQVCLELAEATKEIDLAHEWVRTVERVTHDNYTDFVYFTQQTHAKEESE